MHSNRQAVIQRERREGIGCISCRDQLPSSQVPGAYGLVGYLDILVSQYIYFGNADLHGRRGNACLTAEYCIRVCGFCHICVSALYFLTQDGVSSTGIVGELLESCCRHLRRDDGCLLRNILWSDACGNSDLHWDLNGCGVCGARNICSIRDIQATSNVCGIRDIEGIL